jgi:hypothetical protein
MFADSLFFHHGIIRIDTEGNDNDHLYLNKTHIVFVLLL